MWVNQAFIVVLFLSVSQSAFAASPNVEADNAEAERMVSQTPEFTKHLLQDRTYYSTIGSESFIPNAPSIHIEDIRSVLNSADGPTTIESLLKWIAQKDPNLFQYPALVYLTKSLQEASLTNPRAILSSQNGRFALAFNGGSNQIGYDRVELMEYHPVANVYEFSEVVFQDKKQKLEFRQSPDECMICHTGANGQKNSLKPVWDSYNRWPRVYGNAYDGQGFGETKFKNFVENWKAQKLSERYLLLKGLDRHASIAGDNINNRLNDHLLYWNTQRVRKMILAHPGFSKYKQALASKATVNDALKILEIDPTELYINLDRADPSNMTGGSSATEYIGIMTVGKSDSDYKYTKPVKLEIRDAKRLLQMDCASCHREKNTVDAPPIPFDDTGKLKDFLNAEWKEKILSRLKETKNKARMPLMYPAFSDDEVTWVKEYLDTLKPSP